MVSNELVLRRNFENGRVSELDSARDLNLGEPVDLADFVGVWQSTDASVRLQKNRNRPAIAIADAEPKPPYPGVVESLDVVEVPAPLVEGRRSWIKSADNPGAEGPDIQEASIQVNPTEPAFCKVPVDGSLNVCHKAKWRPRTRPGIKSLPDAENDSICGVHSIGRAAGEILKRQRAKPPLRDRAMRNEKGIAVLLSLRHVRPTQPRLQNMPDHRSAGRAGRKVSCKAIPRFDPCGH